MKINRNWLRIWYFWTDMSIKPTLFTILIGFILFSDGLLLLTGVHESPSVLMSILPYAILFVLGLGALISLLSWIGRIISGLLLSITSQKKDKPYEFKLVRSSRVRR